MPRECPRTSREITVLLVSLCACVSVCVQVSEGRERVISLSVSLCGSVGALLFLRACQATERAGSDGAVHCTRA